MKQTAVEWFAKELNNWRIKEFGEDSIIGIPSEVFEQAKEMEKEQSHQYAEFAIRCDRKDMKILNFEDWIKL